MFKTTCPYCGAEEQLRVVSGVFTTDIPLWDDGFSTSDATYFDTDEVIVACRVCDKNMDISELMCDNYDWVTDEMFDNKLVELINEHPAAHLLNIPGVYEAASEEYNNQVLTALERERE